LFLTSSILSAITDSEEFTQEIQKKFDKLQKKLDDYQSELMVENKKTGGVANNRTKQLEKLIGNLTDEIKIKKRTLVTTKEDIMRQLKEGMNEDISWFQMWLLHKTLPMSL